MRQRHHTQIVAFCERNKAKLQMGASGCVAILLTDLPAKPNDLLFGGESIVGFSYFKTSSGWKHQKRRKSQMKWSNGSACR